MSFFNIYCSNCKKTPFCFNIFVDIFTARRYNLTEVMKLTINTNFHFDKRFMDNAPVFGDTVLYQIGRLHSNSRTKVDTHIHGDLYELTVVTDGCGVITTNGVPVEVSRGDIYLSFPCDTHKIESDREKLLKYDFFAFNTVAPKLREQLEQIVLDHSSAESRVFRDERVSSLVGNAISEFDRELFGSKELLENIFSQILIYTVRSFCEKNTSSRVGHFTNAETLCYRLMNYIDTHIYTMKKLDELTEVMGYSYGYLSALYKKTTSNTLAAYYREKKLEIARLLVCENHLKVGEISEMLNYTSVYAFSKAFKKRFGLSPENYLKSLADQ